MVHCMKCGKGNEEGALFCVNCGASLYPKERREKHEKEGERCFGPERHVEEECFGLPYGGAIAGVVFGLFIIIIGFAIFLGQDVWRWIWPFAVIVVGILIVAGALYGMTRRPKR